MKEVFDPKQHFANCLDLPTRNPKPYYRPSRKRVTPYLSDICVLQEHADGVEKLKESGVPHYLARVMVLIEYAHTWDYLEDRMKESARQ